MKRFAALIAATFLTAVVAFAAAPAFAEPKTPFDRAAPAPAPSEAEQNFEPRVLMVVALVRNDTGVVERGLTVTFPNVAKCKEVRRAALGEYVPPAPPGFHVYLSECLTPGDRSV